jgi:hypothetical protein
MSIGQIFDGHNGTDAVGWYQNSDDDTASVTDADVIPSSATSTDPPTGGNATGSSSPTPTTHLGGAIVGKRVGAGFGGVVFMVMAALLAAL